MTIEKFVRTLRLYKQLTAADEPTSPDEVAEFDRLFNEMDVGERLELSGFAKELARIRENRSPDRSSYL